MFVISQQLECLSPAVVACSFYGHPVLCMTAVNLTVVIVSVTADTVTKVFAFYCFSQYFGAATYLKTCVIR